MCGASCVRYISNVGVKSGWLAFRCAICNVISVISCLIQRIHARLFLLGTGACVCVCVIFELNYLFVWGNCIHRRDVQMDCSAILCVLCPNSKVLSLIIVLAFMSSSTRYMRNECALECISICRAK